MTVAASTPIELIQAVYATLDERLETGRRRLGRPLTLAEKILVNHLDDPEDAGLERGVSYVDLRPDRVALQDATAQMAWLQFMTTGLDEVRVPTTTHCDHLIQARDDGRTDLLTAVTESTRRAPPCPSGHVAGSDDSDIGRRRSKTVSHTTHL